VAATRAERQAALAYRKDALTGTSEFPDCRSAGVCPRYHARRPAYSGKSAANARGHAVHPLSEPFERLRDASDRDAGDDGARPKSFLLISGRWPRSAPARMFAKNFFEVGGIEAVTMMLRRHQCDNRCFEGSGAAVCLPVFIRQDLRERGRRDGQALRAAAHGTSTAGRPGELETR